MVAAPTEVVLPVYYLIAAITAMVTTVGALWTYIRASNHRFERVLLETSADLKTQNNKLLDATLGDLKTQLIELKTASSKLLASAGESGFSDVEKLLSARVETQDRLILRLQEDQMAQNERRFNDMREHVMKVVAAVSESTTAIHQASKEVSEFSGALRDLDERVHVQQLSLDGNRKLLEDVIKKLESLT